MKKLTTEEFIERAVKAHGDKYDYLKVNYINNSIKIEIICPKHNIFIQEPNSHLKGSGCPKCAKINMGPQKPLITTQLFIDKAINIHKNKYDYSNSIYMGTNYPVVIRCRKHGNFFQTPHGHLGGNGCPKCNKRSKITTSTFIKSSQKIHEDTYDYSLVKYKHSKSKINIICKKHGIFQITPAHHIHNKSGCPKCKNYSNITTEIFIKMAKKIHDNRYDYSLSKYIKSHNKIIVICKKHGEFKITPCNHIHSKSGCPKCRSSKGEMVIFYFLKNKKIKFKQEFVFKKCKNKSNLLFDFYLPDYNMCIEYDGIQHFKPIKFFGGHNKYIKQQKNDKIKTMFCKNNNIKLVRINYKENIIKKLNFYIS